MIHPISTPDSTVPGHRWFGGARGAIAISMAVVCAGLMLGAALLWIHYGTAVFFEMIASGIAACI
jgi:hypothetical protein